MEISAHKMAAISTSILASVKFKMALSKRGKRQ